MLSRKMFGDIVKELATNGDFFDPIMLDEFTEGQPDGSVAIRPTTYQNVLEDFMGTNFGSNVDTEGHEMKGNLPDVTADEAYEVINFLETYSDINLYEVHGDEHRGISKIDIDNLIDVWWEMYRSEFTRFVDELGWVDWLFQVRPFEGEATGEAVIAEIVDEIDRGDAHLMTRNELAEFIKWVFDPNTDSTVDIETITGPTSPSLVFTDELDRMMNDGTFHFNDDIAQKIAKAFFIFKGYEKPEGSGSSQGV